MPPPIVPAPITRDLLDLARRRVLGDVGDLGGRALGEERVAQRPRLGRLHEAEEDLALDLAGLRRTACRREAATASMHLTGAGKFFATALTVLRANCEERLGVRGARPSGRARVFSGRFSATTLPAKARAPARKSPSMISSKSAVAFSCSEGTGLPDTIMFSAVSRPTARGRRCVPPAPGQQAQLHLRQRDLRARRGHAEVAGERELEARRPCTRCGSPR